MTRRIITRPDGLDLDSPGRRDYWVALEHDSIWGDHLMPLTVMVSPLTRTVLTVPPKTTVSEPEPPER